MGGSDRRMSSWKAFQLCNNRGEDRRVSTSAEGTAAPDAKKNGVYPRVPHDALLKVREYLGVGDEVPTLVFTAPGANGDGLKISLVDVGADLVRQELRVDFASDESSLADAHWTRGLASPALARAVGLYPGAELATALRNVAHFKAQERKQRRRKRKQVPR